MKKLVRCKICGFVMEEDDLKDVCPACGVLRKMFESYEDPVEPARRKYLALDIHPVIVHVPQALTFLIMLMLISDPYIPAAWADYVEKTLVVMALILPLTVAGAFVTGIVDAKVRFRKLEAPMIQRKMLIGAIYMALVLAMTWFVVFAPGDTPAYRGLVLVLSILAFAACSWLGVIGAKLLPAIFIKLAPARKPKTVAGTTGTPSPAKNEPLPGPAE